MKLQQVLLGSDVPNESQLRLYSNTASDLAKAIFLASGAILFVPSREDVTLFMAILGFLISAALFIAASRFLKEVKNR